MQRDERQPDCCTEQQRTQQDGTPLGPVVGAEGLSGESECRHPKKAEQPEHAVEGNGGERNAAEQTRVAELADRRGGDNAKQRSRQIRDHCRAGNDEHAPMADGKPR